MRVIICIITMLAAVLPAHGASPFDNSPMHENPPRALLVEHAELLITDETGGKAEAFLTIWNGTSDEVRLASVTSETFRSVSTSSSQSNDQIAQQRRFEEFIPIPSHAELRMQPNGIRLILVDPLSPGNGRRTERLTLSFDDGTKLDVNAAIVTSPAKLVRHHHGQAELEPS